MADYRSRIGSNPYASNRLMPYGEELPNEYGTTPNDRVKFATYLRDSDGSDYADQRYYEVGWGRFTTPDPYLASGGVANPSSWNRFAYVEGDPVNWVDPEGLLQRAPYARYDSITVTAYLTPVDYVFAHMDAGLGGGGWGTGFGGGIKGDGEGAGGGLVKRTTAPPTLAKDILKSAFDILKNCAKRFGGRDAVRSYADSMRFVDGRLQGNMNMAGSARTESFADYHAMYPSAVATTLTTRSGSASRTVVLWHDFFGNVAGGHPTPLQDQRVTLVHEFLHSRYNMMDPLHADIIKRFGIDVNPGETNSAAIDRWIEHDCDNKD